MLILLQSMRVAAEAHEKTRQQSSPAACQRFLVTTFWRPRRTDNALLTLNTRSSASQRRPWVVKSETRGIRALRIERSVFFSDQEPCILELKNQDAAELGPDYEGGGFDEHNLQNVTPKVATARSFKFGARSKITDWAKVEKFAGKG